MAAERWLLNGSLISPSSTSSSSGVGGGGGGGGSDDGEEENGGVQTSSIIMIPLNVPKAKVAHTGLPLQASFVNSCMFSVHAFAPPWRILDERSGGETLYVPVMSRGVVDLMSMVPMDMWMGTGRNDSAGLVNPHVGDTIIPWRASSMCYTNGRSHSII